jgi:hypothetical protein
MLKQVLQISVGTLLILGLMVGVALLQTGA